MTIDDILVDLLEEVGEDSDDSTEKARMLRFLKSALRRLPTHVRDRTILGHSTATLSANSSSIDLSSEITDFVKERFVWKEDSGEREPITVDPSGKFHEVVDTIETGEPQLCHFYGKVVEFNNVADVDYVIGFEYWKAVWNVTTASTFAGGDDLIEPVKDIAKYYYYSSEDDDERARGHLNVGMGAIAELDAQYMEREIGTHVEES